MAKVNIHGAEFPVKTVFSNEFVFRIPLYQRPYAWTNEQAGELLDDLLAFMGESREQIDDLDPYFLGSIVLIKGDRPEADVVDGQQRLTTLTILLSALRASVDAEVGNELNGILFEKGAVLLGTPDRPRLTIRERDQDFFRQHVQDKGGIAKLKELDPLQLTEPQRNIRGNALHFLERLASISEGQRIRLAQFILTRCFMVVVATPDLDSAYRIFSVLNNRGLDLSHADILKSEIVGKIPPALQEKYSNLWEQEEVDLGREDFKTLFSHVRAIYLKAKPRESLLKDFRQQVFKPGDDPRQFIDEKLVPYSDSFEIIKNASYQSTSRAEEVNNLLGWLNKVANADWIPPALHYFSKHRHEPANLVQFFTDLERLAVGMMVLHVYTTPRIERYARLLSAIDNGADLYTSDSPLQLTEAEKHNIVAVLDGPLYLQREFRLYVLLRLDAALSEAQEAEYNYPIISVEHVLPQNPAPGSLWVSLFPDPVERENCVHRLGNLVLLSRRKNASASNFDFDKKKIEYFMTSNGVSPFALTSTVLDKPQWTREVLEQRQQNLLHRLKTLWRLT
jgi:uncharacterized protein with ParB-like and HNH nuclease domain